MTAREQPPTGPKVRDSAFLGHFLTPFPNLTAAGNRDLDSTFERLAELLGGSQIDATITFGLVPANDLDADPARFWSLRLAADRTTVNAQRDAEPNLEIILAEDTWMQLAEGTLSPLEAFGRGRMRVLGDLRVARRFAGRLEGVR
jgi:hypothetical protein